MDFLMGLKGRDFVLLCADATATNQIITVKHDEDKLVPVDSHKLIGLSGEAGDRVNFSQFIIGNSKLYALRNGIELSTRALANFTREELATSLRKSPYYTSLLFAGYNEKDGAELYRLDYLCTLHKTNYAGFGYGAFFVLSLFDRFWTSGINEEDAVVLMEKGIEEVKRRLVVAPGSYLIKIVDKDGIRTIKTIS